MRFSFSTLHVKDLQESIRFYSEVIGLETVNQFTGGPDIEVAFMGSSGSQIELVYNGQSTDINVGSDISWAFTVDSLDKALALVKEKGILVEEEPVQPNPHIRFFYIKDPNGLRIQLVENLL